MVILKRNIAAMPEIQTSPRRKQRDADSNVNTAVRKKPKRAPRNPPQLLPAAVQQTAIAAKSGIDFHENVTAKPTKDRTTTTAKQQAVKISNLQCLSGAQETFSVCTSACFQRITSRIIIVTPEMTQTMGFVYFFPRSAPRYNPIAPGATKIPRFLPL